MENPSLEMFPSGFKATKLYSQRPDDGTGDFTHARSTTANRTDVDSAQETMAIDIPLVDHEDALGCAVLLLQPQSTNLYLNNAVMVTQGVTTTATPYTVSFFGTGTITFSGTHTGSLVGTGVNDRVSVTFTPSAGTLTSTISGSVTDGQIENLSYATSVIVTAGSTVTRTADSCNNAGDINSINSPEGVLYIEMAALFDNLSDRFITVSDGSVANRVLIGYNTTTEQIVALIDVGSANQATLTYTSADITAISKIALKWKVNDFALWVDGIERDTDLSGSSFGSSVLDECSFDDGAGANDFYGKIKALRIYQTALSDTDLITLTTP